MEDDNQNISSFDLYYRTENQTSYFKQSMNKVDLGSYASIISPQFVVGDYVEYFIMLQTTSGNTLSSPALNPTIKPHRILIDNMIEEQQNMNYLNSDILILSPTPESYVLDSDLIISLSYFKIENLDQQSIKIYIDDIDMTNKARIFDTHLILDPPLLDEGKHRIKLVFSNDLGYEFNPVKWTFNLVSNNNYIDNSFKYNGRIWNDYIDNSVDQENSAFNTTNFDVKVNSEWLNIKAKLKKSSLESDFEQPKDRYSLLFNNDFIELNLGDIYPNFNQFAINGNRVRGVGFNINAPSFSLKIINGELLRPIQSSDNYGIAISDYYSSFNETLNLDQSILTLTRENYTFEKEIAGLKLLFGNEQYNNFSLSLIKSKDNISSIDKYINNSVLILPESFDNYNSDQFIDKNNNNIFDIDDELYLDYDNDGIFDSFQSLEGFPNGDIFIDPDTSVFIVGSIEQNEETYNVKQYIWDLKLDYINNESLIEDIHENFPGMVDEVQFLDSLWNGNKPEDNIVFGTDLNLLFS